MEQQFKNFVKKTKAWDQRAEPLSHTFEGALFQDSSWFLNFSDSIKTHAVEVVSTTLTKVQNAPSEPLSLVLFIGDSGPSEKGEDLLGKMILAMKLDSHEFNRVPFNESLDEVTDLEKNLITPSEATLELFGQIQKFKPQVVVSLGATVTNILLGRREKLSSIHGQFFVNTVNVNGEGFAYHLIPIFHPEFLLINPNMKRTAWIDLQKVMEKIGKS